MRESTRGASSHSIRVESEAPLAWPKGFPTYYKNTSETKALTGAQDALVLVQPAGAPFG